MSAQPTEKVRSFVDLRSFAASVLADEDAGSSYLDSRHALALADGPVAVFALALHGVGNVEALPADEFLILLAGELRIAGGLAEVVLSPGRSIVLPRGAAFGWAAIPGTQIVIMRCADGEAGTDHIVPIDEEAMLEPSGAPLAELLVGATPSCRNHTDYRSASGEFLCGTWDSTPYHRRAMRYGHYELMHLLSGAVSFQDENGTTATFKQDDIFLVEQGASCSWLSESHVKKVYAIYRPI